MSANFDEREKTIRDFGEQWLRHTSNSGYYGSLALLEDLIAPFLTTADFRGRRCAEIGAGTGRIVGMMLEAGADHVTAIEPSQAYEVLVRNTAHSTDRVRCLNVHGEQIPPDNFDIILSIGVLHHIPDPRPVVDAAWNALRDGGRILIWLYGAEGSGVYRMLFQPVRQLTRRLPVRVNEALATALYPAVMCYAGLARIMPSLPLSTYLQEVYLRLEPAKRRLVILDQINPQYAKYYTRSEAVQLLAASGFDDVQVHHRHGYSWTVTGVKRTKE